ncbi:hypothetical protein [Vibrio sp. TBV020]|uniref:hypothetical protein n=1 Tax=Vibrio sp. TBV020 TaxID=3137398 RepID=UPI0038CD5D12
MNKVTKSSSSTLVGNNVSPEFIPVTKVKKINNDRFEQSIVSPTDSLFFINNNNLNHSPLPLEVGAWYRTQLGLEEKDVQESELEYLGKWLNGLDDENSKQVTQEIQHLWMLKRELRLMIDSVIGV